MAAAMARGWAGAEGGPEGMLFCDLDRERASALADEVGGETRQTAGRARRRERRDPAGGEARCPRRGAPEMGNTAPAILSVMAATSTERLAQAFPDTPIMRVMPNQPVEVRRGVLCHPPPVDMPEELDGAPAGPAGRAGHRGRPGRGADRGGDGGDVVRARLRGAVRGRARQGGRRRRARPCALRSSWSPRRWPAPPSCSPTAPRTRSRARWPRPEARPRRAWRRCAPRASTEAIAAAVHASLERFR